MVLIGSSICPWSRHSLQAQEPVDFSHQILPVLKAKCAQCHSNGVYKGGLSLEDRDGLIDSGTIEIGDHASSELFRRVTSTDPDEQMPPPDSGPQLTDAETGHFAKWIDGGLNWPTDVSLKKPTFKRAMELSSVKIPDDPRFGSHPIDQLLAEYLKSHAQETPALLSDPQFLRRSKLDLLGQLPTATELRDFASADPETRNLQWIDELLARDRDYADHWMSFWNDLLRNDYAGTGYIDGGRKQITTWLHRSLIENKPYDRLVRELIQPSGESEGFIRGIKWRGRVNASQIEPLQFSQNISQVFLGINMKCASCHDSFIDDWKLADAYGLAAITSEQPLEMHRCDVPTGKMASAKFVFPSLGSIDSSLPRQERLSQLADLMTSPKNGRFSRTIVNRIWHRMAGRGMVHPVDVMANEAWSESLLDFLAADLVEHDYDLKRTIRLIATSQIYRSQSVTEAAASGNGSGESGGSSSGSYVFRGIQPKRLTAEQFVDAVWELTGAAPENPDAAIYENRQPLAAKWIWSQSEFKTAPAGSTVTFRHQLDLKSKPETATAIVSADNRFVIFVNGQRAGEGIDYAQPQSFDVRPFMNPGRNEILIQVTNEGATPNPAAMTCAISMSNSTFDSEVPPTVEDAVTSWVVGSDRTWEWSTGAVDPASSGDVSWQAAVEPIGADELYAAVGRKLENLIVKSDSGESRIVRASLVKSDLLMRSLGRPNRDQVVTTRPAELSTLQALDLSNGALLTQWLSTGAEWWSLEKQTHQWTDRELVDRVFQQALSRPALDSEIKILTPLESSDPQSAIEDLLWMVVMLPEFQIVR